MKKEAQDGKRWGPEGMYLQWSGCLQPPYRISDPGQVRSWGEPEGHQNSQQPGTVRVPSPALGRPAQVATQ